LINIPDPDSQTFHGCFLAFEHPVKK